MPSRRVKHTRVVDGLKPHLQDSLGRRPQGSTTYYVNSSTATILATTARRCTIGMDKFLCSLPQFLVMKRCSHSIDSLNPFRPAHAMFYGCLATKVAYIQANGLRPEWASFIPATQISEIILGTQGVHPRERTPHLVQHVYAENRVHAQ
jgi:hypothetical protein